MRLFLAEKPSLARAIAEALPGPQRKQSGYIECGPNDTVAWCAGHILELADADAYAAEYKTWTLEHLPILPKVWRMAVKSADLLKTIRTLLPRATRVVHAGDPDREGQLLVDEVLDYLQYKGPVDRVRINDLNQGAVRKALGSLEPNAKYRSLSDAAHARQKADWLYGINLTRLYTLLGRAGGHDGVLSVGRVQTPLLGLIVRRDLEVESFVQRPYFVLRANIVSAKGSFVATWIPRDDLSPSLDDNHRLLSREIAQGIQARTSGAAGVVSSCAHDKKTEPAPLPYCLSDLQVEASRRFGVTAKQVLDCCQALYETHRLITYPRSDCSFLPEGHLSESGTVLHAIAKMAPSLVPLVSGTDLRLRSRAWNDAKVTAHHAIIPTSAVVPDAPLSPTERGIYELICCRYIAQFYPPHEYHQTNIQVVVAGESFRAIGRSVIADGWKSVLPAAPDPDEPRDPQGDDSSDVRLPLLQPGEAIRAEAPVSLLDRKTLPPKRFTDATLIQAMKGVARFVADPAIKKLLQEADGIGTPATQAAIIQTLYDRQYIERKAGHVISTAVGRALISTLPAVATTPDMTALWEAAMKRIAEGQMPYAAFLAGVSEQLTGLVAHGLALRSLTVPGSTLRPCPRAGCSGALRLRKGRKGSFWACSGYPACTQTLPAESPVAPRSGRGLPKRRRRSRGL